MLWYETSENMPKRLKVLEKGFTYNEAQKMATQDRDSGLMNQISKIHNRVVEIVVEKKVIEERIVEVMVAGGTSSRLDPKFAAGQSVHQ